MDVLGSRWPIILLDAENQKYEWLSSIFKFGDKILLNVLGQEVLKYDSIKS